MNQLLIQQLLMNYTIDKVPINTDYSAFTEKIETNPKAPKFKVNDRVRITKFKNILVKVTLTIFQQKYYYRFCFEN